ncbi:MAG: pyrroline-5-carboxylate reductase [Betaproteobacteria bacterium]|nr:pyrroline-5-carboxylate reductase [Betaproteobacteria bacterium]
MKIVFIGGGNMAGALIGGLLAKGFSAQQMRVVEVLADARARIAEHYGVACEERLDGAPAADEIVLLAVKPQQIGEAARVCGVRRDANLVISIAAGVRLATLARRLGGHRRLVRAMPNTPALIGAGITGLYANPNDVSEQDREYARAIMAAVGEVVWLEDEAQMDVVTAVSGSGPAYVFWFIEQLAAAGTALGLAPDTARRLALETVHGAARLAAGSAESPAVLRERVTSKGGTTEAALRVFAEEQLGERLARAIESATRRGAELGNQLDRAD